MMKELQEANKLRDIMIEDFEERNQLLRKNLGYQLDKSLVISPESEEIFQKNSSFHKEASTKPASGRPPSSRVIRVKKAPEEKFEFAEEK
jgi:hypothetical protein